MKVIYSPGLLYKKLITRNIDACWDILVVNFLLYASFSFIVKSINETLTHLYVSGCMIGVLTKHSLVQKIYLEFGNHYLIQRVFLE